MCSRHQIIPSSDPDEWIHQSLRHQGTPQYIDQRSQWHVPCDAAFRRQSITSMSRAFHQGTPPSAPRAWASSAGGSWGRRARSLVRRQNGACCYRCSRHWARWPSASRASRTTGAPVPSRLWQLHNFTCGAVCEIHVHGRLCIISGTHWLSSCPPLTPQTYMYPIATTIFSMPCDDIVDRGAPAQLTLTLAFCIFFFLSFILSVQREHARRARYHAL